MLKKLVTQTKQRRIRRLAIPVLVCALLLIIWEVSVDMYSVSSFILPKPSTVASTIVSDYRVLLRNAIVTTGEAVTGMLVASIAGLLLAISLSLSNVLKDALEPLIAAFQSFPKEAIAPLLIVWFGFGFESKVVLAASISFFPIFVSCLHGIRAVPSDVRNVLTAMRATKLQMLVQAEIPFAVPSIVSGLRVAWTLSIVGAVIAEFVGSSAGLGNLILLANSQFEISLVFASLVVLAIMGLLGDFIIRVLGARLAPWYGHHARGLSREAYI